MAPIQTRRLVKDWLLRSMTTNMESTTKGNRILHGSSRSQGPRLDVQRMGLDDKSESASCLLSDTQTSTREERNYKFSKCGNCKYCVLCFESNIFKSSVSQRSYRLKINMNCKSKFVIYLITCQTCGMQYVGKTVQELKERTGQHVRKCDTLNTHLAKHFRNKDHKFCILAIDQLDPESTEDHDQKLEDLELHWMKELRIIYPYGLNERVKGF